LQTAVELDAKNANAHRLLARVAAQQNDLALAQGELRRALALKPTAELHFERGVIEGQLGNLVGAAAEFRSALALNPRLAGAHRLLGVTLRRQGNASAALAQFRRAVQLDPKDPESQCDLGMQLKSSGDMVGAIVALQKAIALKPDFEKAHYNLGIALRSQGKSEAGQKELDEISALREFRARLAQAKMLTLQGVDALKREKFDDAAGLFHKAIEQSPELPT